MRVVVLLAFAVGCNAGPRASPTTPAPSDPPPPASGADAPASPLIVTPDALAAAWAEADTGVIGTILVRELRPDRCGQGARVLLHVEATMRPSASIEEEGLGALHWLRVRASTADPACAEGPRARIDVAALVPGERIAVLARSDRRAPAFGLVDEADPELLIAVPFGELAALAALVPPAQTMWTPLARSTPRLEALSADFAIDRATGLRWQRGSSEPLGEASAHAYCDALTLDARDDWRVASAVEALTLFPPAPSSSRAGADAKVLSSPAGWYWTWHDGKNAEPWVVDYTTGDLADTHYDDPDSYGPYRVRCVADHLPEARRLLPHQDLVEVGPDTVTDRALGLTWQTAAREATSSSVARAACPAPWRLPSTGELRLQDLRGLGPIADLEDTSWSDAGPPPMAAIVESTSSLARCVRDATPPALGAGDLVWEHGTVAQVDDERRFPSGRLAARMPRRDGRLDGEATFFDHEGKVVAQLHFRAGVLDGAVSIDDGYTRVRGAARAGLLDGTVELDVAPSTTGAMVGGARDGTWTVRADGAVTGELTYRAGQLDGPAWGDAVLPVAPDARGRLRGIYRAGLVHDTWTWTSGSLAGQGAFVDGTGTWEVSQGAVVRWHQPMRGGLSHGDAWARNAAGKTLRATSYIDGRVVADATWSDDGTPRWRQDGTGETRYFDDGRVSSELVREPSGARASFKRWNEGGWLQEWGAYVDGERDGPWSWRSGPAEPVMVTTWRHGRVDGPPRRARR